MYLQYYALRIIFLIDELFLERFFQLLVVDGNTRTAAINNINITYCIIILYTVISNNILQKSTDRS